MMKSNGLPLHKAHHIARTQGIELQLPIGNALGKKAPGKRQIERHRCRCDPALSIQVLSEFPLQLLGRSRFALQAGCNDAFDEEKVKQPLQHRRIAPATAVMTRAVLQIALKVIWRKLRGNHSPPTQPPTEIRHQP
jgi:hypothetical protein